MAKNSTSARRKTEASGAARAAGAKAKRQSDPETAIWGFLEKIERPQATSARIGKSAFTAGARVRALLRGVERAKEDLIASGGALDLDQVRALMHGVSRQSVEKRVREGSLLAVPGPGNRRFYPAAQFQDDGTIVPGLKEVLAALPTRNGYATLNFLVRPDSRLGGRRPIDVIKTGKIELVIKAAEAVGEQGA